MLLGKWLKEANGEQAYKELEEVRRKRIAQGAGPIALLEANSSGAGVVSPDDSLRIHQELSRDTSESELNIPNQRTSEESTEKDLVGAGK